MGIDVDRGDFYNTYNFMSTTSFMGFIGYTGYLWGERERGTAYIFPKTRNTLNLIPLEIISPTEEAAIMRLL